MTSGLRLADGRVATFPSLDGQGIAVDPHAERPDVTWLDITERFGLDIALRLQQSAAAAELAHVSSGQCSLEIEVPRT